MARSYDKYTANGVKTTWTVNFDYIATSHVEVYLDGVLKTESTDYTWPSATQIQFTSAPASGVQVYFQRKTSHGARLTDYEVPSNLSEETLDNDSLQAFYMAQEAIDIVDDAISLDVSDDKYDANSKVIKNVADPSSAQDAATKNYVDTEITGAGNVPAADNPGDDDKVIAASGGTWTWQKLTAAMTSFSTLVKTILGRTTAADIRSDIGAASSGHAHTGTYQPLADDLTDIAALAHTRGGRMIDDGTDWVRDDTPLAGFRNRIINGGAPFVNQRGTKTGMTTGTYFTDRWRVDFASSAVATGSVATSGGNEWVEVDITTADAAIAAGDFYVLRQRIEANNITDLLLGTANAKQVTLSFKHKHTKAGTYCVSFSNAAGNRSYVAEYTQSVADTEETAVITLTLDTTGTWATGTGVGLDVNFTLAAGSSSQGTANAWAAAGNFGTANQVNALDTIGNKFRVRDVQLELGAVATPFERRPYATELALCLRYCFAQGPAANGDRFAIGEATSATQAQFPVRWPVRMRGAPSLSLSAAGDFDVTNAGGTIAVTGMTLEVANAHTGVFNATVASGLAAGRASQLASDSGAVAKITLDAEL